MILQVVLSFGAPTLSEAKRKGKKTRQMNNKAAWVIELGKGLPTISQLSNEQGLWIY